MFAGKRACCELIGGRRIHISNDALCDFLDLYLQAKIPSNSLSLSQGGILSKIVSLEFISWSDMDLVSHVHDFYLALSYDIEMLMYHSEGVANSSMGRLHKEGLNLVAHDPDEMQCIGHSLSRMSFRDGSLATYYDIDTVDLCCFASTLPTRLQATTLETLSNETTVTTPTSTSATQQALIQPQQQKHQSLLTC
jgi:hypothetical protein